MKQQHNPALEHFEMTREEYQSYVRASMAAHRLELLHLQAKWIHATEGKLRTAFIRGSDIDVARIDPILEPVLKSAQRDLWRYCRLWGAIPYTKGCGRRLLYLLRDAGQPGRPVMGVIGLASPVILCKPRDQWIGWHYPKDVEIKKRRLLNCMDLTVSMAVPPYNHLTAGKMICLATLSNEVRQDYYMRYHATPTPTGMREGRLALISTTSLYGSSVQYNRIRFENRLAFQPVGYTSGFGNAHLTEAQFAEMESYLESVDKKQPKAWGTGRSYRMRVMTAYQRQRPGTTQGAPHEQTRSVYVAPLASNAQRFLTEQDTELLPFDAPFSTLVDRWKHHWLEKRLANPEVLARFRAADPFTQLLSAELANTVAPFILNNDEMPPTMDEE